MLSDRWTNMFGFRVHRGGIREFADDVISTLKRKAGLVTVFAINPHSLEQSQTDIEFHKALLTADFLFPDGVGVALASRVLCPQRMVMERVTGFDVFVEISNRLNRERIWTCGFIGSTPEVLAKLKAKYQEEFPNIKVVLCISPPFTRSLIGPESDRLIREIEKTRPDILWVGLSAPKQEKWVSAYGQVIRADLCCAIGAVFDFYAGAIVRPSKVMRKLGLEWLGRLIREPRRLWRRTLISAPRFALRVILEAVRLRAQKQG